MKINELTPNSKVINLVATIATLKEKAETATGIPMQEAILEDSTGQVPITFWDEHIDAYKEGDKILLVSGWCKSFEGNNAVSTGKFGKIKKVPIVPEGAE